MSNAITTLCWNCGHEYDIKDMTCPKCGKANANVNLTLAVWQMTEPPFPIKQEQDSAMSSASLEDLEAMLNSL